jgi:hypothetical protein
MYIVKYILNSGDQKISGRYCFSFIGVLEDRYFKYGQLMAYLIAHGGPYPAFLGPKLVGELLGGPPPHYDLDDIPEDGLRQKLQNVST